MKKKQGFTLIELLAVIVILAVIALIAIPIVIGIIDDAKENAALQSANGVVEASNLYYQQAMLKNDMTDIDGNINIYNKVKNIIKNHPSGNPEIKINDKGEIALAVIYDDYCMTKQFDGKVIMNGKNTVTCLINQENLSEGSYASVTFLDWDNTIIGSTTVKAGKNGTDIINDVTNKMKATNLTEKYNTDALKPLTNKKGYDFNSWVIVDKSKPEETFTSFALESEISNKADFSNITTNLTVKAAYVENEYINLFPSGSGASTYAYSLDVTYYMRQSTYWMDFKIQRKNADQNGVTRLKKPALRITYTYADGKNFYGYHEIDNKDLAMFSLFIPYNAVSNINLVVIDNENNHFPLNNNMSPALNFDYNSIIKEASITAISEYGSLNIKKIIEENTTSSDFSNSLNYTNFTALGLDSILVDIKNQNPTATTAMRRESIAKNRIQLYMIGKGMKRLTQEEITEAVSMNTATNLKYTTSAEYLKPIFQYVEAKYQAKGSELTVEEIKNAISEYAVENPLI